MPRRERQTLKKRLLLLVAVLIILVGAAILYFSHHRTRPEIAAVLDRPNPPKLTRPVRKNTARTDEAKKMVEKTDKKNDRAYADVPVGCLKKSTYDPASRTLFQEIDNECDGVVNECLVQILNDYGEPIRSAHYKSCGKVPSSCNETEYNEYGEDIAYYYDRDCDGRVDVCLTQKRNEHGDIVEWYSDKDCDGVSGEGEVRRCSTFVYDEDGLAVSEKEGDCGKPPEYCAEYEYDLALGTRRSKGDIDCDGTVDGCNVSIYRDGYRNADSFHENNCDGTWESCTIMGEVDWIGHTIKGREACEKRFAELTKEKR